MNVRMACNVHVQKFNMGCVQLQDQTQPYIKALRP